MLAKRSDGFHEIASLYQAITLGDFLTISFNNRCDTLNCTDSSVPTDSLNIIIRAANLFRQKTGINDHFSFFLDKRIPIEAGLGGGSSNAATALWGLSQLLGFMISDKILSDWASELGSDVPFFLTKGRAYCEGRGEILSPEPMAASEAIWIAKPKEGLSTPAVYREVNLERLKNRDPKEALHSHRSSSPIFFNDLEDAAFRLRPQLKKTKIALLELGFDQVHMSGSGTAFFCIGSTLKPSLPQIDFYPVQFLSREEQSWYKFPS